jgi:hypothetical protein
MTTKDTLITLRSLSSHFNKAMKTYLPIRLQQQAFFINAFLEENKHFNDQYLLLVHTQIPLSRGNWLTSLEFSEVSANLKTAITRQDITNVRDFLRMKKSGGYQGKQSRKLDRIIEPICRLLGIEPERKCLADGILSISYTIPFSQYLS